MNEKKLIIVRDLIKSFRIGRGDFVALDKINLEFQKGEFTGIVGPSGSGKTTLLNIIGSLDVPSSGSVTVLGNDISSLNQKKAAELRNASMGFIFQTYNLLPVYNVFENVELPLLLLRHKAHHRRESVMKALEWVGLTSKEKSRPAQLSGGECQRVAIARAMVKKPALVLADEPTANLDADNSHNILQVMENLNRQLETTFIFSTHDEKVIQYLRRKISLDDGRVVNDEIMEPSGKSK